MIQMAATIEFDGWTQSDLRVNVTFRNSLFHLLLGDVQIVHVGCVMFRMMQLHNLSAYDWFQGLVIVGQIGKCVLRPCKSIFPAEKRKRMIELCSFST